MTDERRLVTVLFADVVGSTAMGEELDPEDLRTLLSRYFAISREVVEAHGGTVEKFIGDAVMAVFGLPRAHGDDPVRALHAALQLRDRVRDDAQLGERLPIRIGVNTGEVVAARDGSGGDFLVTGDAVNAGARLQQAAEPWQVLVGDRTARSVRDGFEFGPPAHVEAKGKAGGLHASELRGIGRRRDTPRARAPFVGRQSDIAQLELLAQRAFAERTPYLVTVLAPAGTGKTRLLEEFLARLRRSHPDAAVAIAQCLPYGQRLTYWPLRALLLGLLDLDEDADPQALRRSLGGWLHEHAVADADDVLRLVAATVGAGEIETSDRSALFAAWRQLIEVAAAEHPLVLVIEDLHWSSDSLLELIEFVLQPRGDVPLLMVALSRPELLDRRPAWGGGRRNHLSLVLGPLADRSVEELVRNLVEGASPEVVEGVVRRAEGNPFYAGEIVQSLVERADSLHGGRSFEDALATLPDTVQATVLARLDLLPTAERETLRIGSVFGRSFRAAGVASLAPELGDVATAACDALVERDMIRQSGVDGYAFRHIVIREVAYGTLPRAERARLHAAAARWLEDRPAEADTLAELIAFHYREAATLGKSLAGGLDPQLKTDAAEWLEKAAHVARAGAATVEATRHLRAAIEFADETRLPELYEQLGQVDLSGPDRTSAFQRARELASAQGRSANERLRIASQLQLVYLREVGSVATRPSNEQMEDLRRETASLAAEADDPLALATYYIAESYLPTWLRGLTGRYASEQELQTAEWAARQGLVRAEATGDLRLASIALDGLGSLAQERLDYRTAADVNKRRLAFGNQVDLVETIDAHAMVVWNLMVLGELDEAELVARTGMALLQPGQVPAWALHLATWRVTVLRLRGSWDTALEVVEQARRLWIEAGRPSAGYALRGFAAAADIARARLDESRFADNRAVIREVAMQFPPSDPKYLLRFVEDDLDFISKEANYAEGATTRLEARSIMIRRAIDIALPLSADAMKSYADLAERAQAPVYKGLGLRGLAQATSDPGPLDEAVALFEKSNAQPDLGRALFERGRLKRDPAGVAAGRRILDGLGDMEQINRYDAAARRVV